MAAGHVAGEEGVSLIVYEAVFRARRPDNRRLAGCFRRGGGRTNDEPSP